MAHHPHHQRIRLHLHSAALVIEAIGTMFIFLDTVRMNAQLHAAGFVSYEGGPPPGYEGWIYHSAPLGFALLFLGILLAGFVLWFEHRAMVAQPVLSLPSEPGGRSPTEPS